jgi:hypothetical protein
MPERKRVFLRLAGGTGVFLVLLAAVLILLPRLVDRDRVRARVAAEASTAVGGTVEIRGLDLSYWPYPHLAVRGVTLDIPGAAAGTIRTLTIYPRILPLLLGKVRVSELLVGTPAFTVTIPEREETDFTLKLRSLLDSMARSAPDLRIVLTDGRLNVSGGGLPSLSFREIEGSAVLPPAGPDLDLSCAGTLWDRGSVKGHFDAERLSGAVQVILKGFRPHLLDGYIFPASGTGISDSDVDLDLRVETDGRGKLRAGGDVSFSRMALYRGKRNLELTGGKIQGTLDRAGEKATVALTRLSLESPRLLLSGNLFLDGVAEQSRADVQARQVDIAILREQALALAGDVPLVKEIFSVVKAGSIPVLSFRAGGKSAADLVELENMEFEGSVGDGSILVDVQGADLAIGRIRGDLALRRGFLEASNLEGDLGKNSARRGTFRMGFLGPDPPFHLEAYVAADVSELPPLLHLLIPSESFRKELSRVEELSGSARGRLVLGETVKSIKAAVEIDAMSLSGKVRGLPYPLTVSGGQLLYRENEIAVTGAKGRFGQTTFSELAGKVRMTDPASLEVRSGEFRLFLDEVYQWARTSESLRESLSKVESASGTVALSVSRLEGPLLAPGEWRFDISGNVERLSLSTPSVPGMIEIPRGSFQASPDTFRFENLRANLLDASISASGSLEGYRTDTRRGVVTGGGRFGPEMIGFLYEQGKIPPGFAVRPPLEASGLRLEWQKDSTVTLVGDFLVGDGVKISVDLFRPPGEWVVRNLSLQDRDSRASLSLHRKPESLELAFEGLLTRESANRIFVSEVSPGGSLKGDFQASLRLDQPMRSMAQGTLEGKELRFLQNMKIPVFIDSLSLSAEGSRISIRDAGITIGNSPVRLQGEATASPDGFSFEMDASTPGIDWEALQAAFGTPDAKEGSPGTESGAGEGEWDAPVQGTVRLRAGYFRYGRHTLEPVNAEIALGKTGVNLSIGESTYCGVPFTGTLRRSSGELTFELQPAAKGQDIESFYNCLTEEQGRVTGRFDLAGKIEGRIRHGEDPVPSLRGNLDFTARDGTIYGTPLLSRVLSFLSVTELFRGRLPDMRKEGLQYRSLANRGDIQDGNATVTMALDGDLPMVGHGKVDLVTQELDLQILVAPTKTTNTVIRKIPVLGHILGGTLVQVPVRVTGTFEDSKVSLLEPAAVAKNLLGIAERTFLLPVELIRPVLPGERKVDQ